MLMIVAGLIQAAAPVSVECALTGRMEGESFEEPGLTCPMVELDPEGLTRAAQGVVNGLDASYDVGRLRPFKVMTDLVFEHDGEGWRLPAPAVFFGAHPDYPVSAVERGLNARCDLAITLNAAGRAQSMDVVCEQYRRTDRTEPGPRFVRAAREAAGRLVYFMPEPGEDAHCVETSYDFVLVGDDPLEDSVEALERPVEGAPRCPEADG